MTNTEVFNNVLNVATAICEFIKNESRITGATFGVSTSVVTARFFEKVSGLEHLEERSELFFQDLRKMGVKELRIESFSDGVKSILLFNEKSKKYIQEQDKLPDGFLFRVEMNDGRDLILRDPEVFCSKVGPVLKPLLDTNSEPELFLNGESLTHF